MYDPSLHRFVHGLMRKTFIQMLAEFKRLGSHVIYADFGRILLATSKPPGTAHAYATYINTAVTSNELFQHVYLNTERFYDFLILMDQANMAGIVCEDPLAIEPPEELSLEMKWNIQEFLPPAIQDDFAAAVRFFVVELFRSRQKLKDLGRAPLRVIENGVPDATQKNAQQTKETEIVQEFISRRLTRRMLKLVSSIQDREVIAHREGEDSVEAFMFPIRPGSHLNLTNTALEFVKFTCAVFALVKDHSVEVGLLKRNLLELVGVKEFADAAIFRNPCEPLKLSNVPCRYCDSIRDFDFCRDSDLQPDGQQLASSVRWLCVDCGGEYDRLAIELTIIEMVHEIERTSAQQDLRCSKCKQIQSDNLSKHCHCSGAYELTVSRVDVRRKLRTIVNVARAYGFSRLREMADRMLLTHSL